MERNKGKLVPTDITTEGFTDDDWDELCETGLCTINGKVYKVIWEVEQESDCEVSENEDGTAYFHKYRYNGDALWTEVVEHVLKGSVKDEN